MRKIGLLFILLLMSHFSFAQSQTIYVEGELREIYSDFKQQDSQLYKKYLEKHKSSFLEKDENKKRISDSLYSIDYKKYREELKPHKIVKIDRLKELLKNLNKENPLIGKINIYVKDNPEEVEKVNQAKKNPEFAHFEYVGISKSEEKDLLIDKDKILAIRTDFTKYFDTSYFTDSGSSVLSAKISFVLDEDGYFKTVKPVDGNEEFAYFCAISLFDMHKKYNPNTYKGKPILTRYILPIKMQFE